MSIVWKRFGPTLKVRRQRAKLTQAALAESVGVTNVYIAYLEGSRRRPSLELVEALAKTLRCRVRDLLPE